MTDTLSIRNGVESEVRRFWPAILACFVTAVFGWGFGFSGPSVYLAELQRVHGWSTGRIASAITAYYLLGALFLARVDIALRWFSARCLLVAGTVLLGLGPSFFARSQQPWELYVAAVPMAFGWAGCTSTAISMTLALYFHLQRGLAITLALNGASAADFTIGSLLVELSQNIGVGDAVPLAAVAALAVVLPLTWFGIKPGAEIVDETPIGGVSDFPVSGGEWTWQFWSIALPFALVLAAQVVLIVHLVSFLLPRLGADGAAAALSLTSIAAVSGRLVLAGAIDRLHQRRAAAASFASQAVGLGLMLTFSSTPAALYGGCLLFGLSVGNVITFPALIVQREFPPSAFGRVIGLSTAISQFTFALAPWLLGIVQDITGGYGAVLCLCMTAQLTAALLVLCRAPKTA